MLLTLFTVASLLVVGGDAPLHLEVGGGLAVELAVGPRLGQRKVAAGGRLAGLVLEDTHTHGVKTQRTRSTCSSDGVEADADIRE